MKNKTDYTHDWQLYMRGQDYNNKLSPSYYDNINKNHRMYIGDQWFGVQANGLPTPVFNIFKRIINHQIASITSQDTKMQLISEGLSDGIQDAVTGEMMDMQFVTDLLSSYFDDLWEKSKMAQKIRQLLLDGALSGDYCLYSTWDDEYKTGQYSGIDDMGTPVQILGDICNEMVDSVNVFFGNPNDRRVNEGGRPKQPYIIISFREMTSKVKAEAKKYGANSDDIDKICADDDTEYQAGDRGKVELDGYDGDEYGKTTCIIKLFPKDGRIYARKSTKHCVVRKDWDTKLTIYPVAFGNWDIIKNSYHGQALGTGLVPNQIFINKLFAMAMVSVMNTAFPRIAYDSTKISAISNMVGASIGIEGDTSGAIQVIKGGDMSAQVMQLIDNTIAYTKDMLGASDAAMGDVKPDNTSAIIAVQQAAAIPLETIKLNMYQFIEDVGYIWLDYIINYYGVRTITAEIAGEQVVKTIDFSQLKDKNLRMKVDVGASAYWSQLASVQTLDNLLSQDRISFKQYLERLPDGFVNKKQALISELEAKEEAERQALAIQQQQQQVQQPTAQAGAPATAEQLVQFVQTLPAEVQQQLMQMDEQTRYDTAVQLMQQNAQ